MRVETIQECRDSSKAIFRQVILLRALYTGLLSLKR
jgi:hypothetical protein